MFAVASMWIGGCCTCFGGSSGRGGWGLAAFGLWFSHFFGIGAPTTNLFYRGVALFPGPHFFFGERLVTLKRGRVGQGCRSGLGGCSARRACRRWRNRRGCDLGHCRQRNERKHREWPGNWRNLGHENPRTVNRMDATKPRMGLWRTYQSIRSPQFIKTAGGDGFMREVVCRERGWAVCGSAQTARLTPPVGRVPWPTPDPVQQAPHRCNRRRRCCTSGRYPVMPLVPGLLLARGLGRYRLVGHAWRSGHGLPLHVGCVNAVCPLPLWLRHAHVAYSCRKKAWTLRQTPAWEPQPSRAKRTKCAT